MRPLLSSVVLATIGAMAGAAPSQQEPARAAAAAIAPVLRHGRLVDVHGLRRRPGGFVPEPWRRGVLVAPDVARALPAGCRFVPGDPDSRRRRIAIDHEIGSPAFAAAVRALEAGAVVVRGEGEVAVARDTAWTVTWPDGVARPAPDVAVRTAAGADLPVLTFPCTGGVLVDPVVMGTPALVRGLPRAYGLPAGTHGLHVRWPGGAIDVPVRAAGLLPDAEPLRIVGELKTWLEHTGRRDAHTLVLTLFVGDLRQAIGRGDVLRVVDPVTNAVIAAGEAADDVAAVGQGGPQRVHVPVRLLPAPDAAAELERRAARALPGCPPPGPARDAFVREHGAEVVLVLHFQAERGDDPANFVRVDDHALSSTDGNRFEVSPHAGFAVAFSAPVDPASLPAMQLTDRDRQFVVAARLLARDATDMAFELRPPLGLSLTPDRRRQILAEREHEAAPSMDFELAIAGGTGGVRSRTGQALGAPLAFAFQLDPEAPDNLVGQRAWVAPVGR